MLKRETGLRLETSTIILTFVYENPETLFTIGYDIVLYSGGPEPFY